jgi:hypothetical protein
MVSRCRLVRGKRNIRISQVGHKELVRARNFRKYPTELLFPDIRSLHSGKPIPRSDDRGIELQVF